MRPRKPRVHFICAYAPCGSPFSVIPSQAPKAKYCSKLCHNRANGEATSAKAQALWVPRHCAYALCGKFFMVAPWRLEHLGQAQFCSPACSRLAYGLVSRTPLAERFWAKVAITGPTECWLWQAATYRNGYGNIWVNERQKKMSAHVVSWYLHTGDWPSPRLFVCHNCPDGDNPTCVNPHHLWLGTQSQNLYDAGAKGHMSHPETRLRGDDHWTRLHPEQVARGERNGNAKMTDAQREEALALYATGTWTQTQLAQRYGVYQTTISKQLQQRP